MHTKSFALTVLLKQQAAQVSSAIPGAPNEKKFEAYNLL
jgi:hypothetical protein